MGGPFGQYRFTKSGSRQQISIKLPYLKISYKPDQEMTNGLIKRYLIGSPHGWERAREQLNFQNIIVTETYTRYT
jgi:hypothetical protein